MTGIEMLSQLVRDIEPDSDPRLYDILRSGTEERHDADEGSARTLREELIYVLHALRHENLQSMDNITDTIKGGVNSIAERLGILGEIQNLPIRSVCPRIVEELDKRLMPEDYEWPRYESGEPVRFGDAFLDHQGDVRSVLSIEMWQEGGFTLHTGQGTEDWHSAGERVKRPAVLAADGEPLEVGQTVWGVSNGIEFTVIGFLNSGEYQAVKLRLNDGAFTGLGPDHITHQRPVLDADGVPIKVGDTVWPKYPYEEPDRQVESAEVVYVHRLERVDIQAKYATGMSFRQQVDAKQLTHTKPEPPESYVRLYSATKSGEVDFGEFVRRCMKLAERERGE